MVVFVEDFDRIIIADFEYRLAEFGVSIALRLRKPVVIDLRLGVMVRRIAGPAASRLSLG